MKFFGARVRVIRTQRTKKFTPGGGEVILKSMNKTPGTVHE